MRVAAFDRLPVLVNDCITESEGDDEEESVAYIDWADTDAVDDIDAVLIPEGSRFEKVVRADTDSLDTDESVAETVREALLRDDADKVSDDFGDVDGKCDDDSDLVQPEKVERGDAECDRVDRVDTLYLADGLRDGVDRGDVVTVTVVVSLREEIADGVCVQETTMQVTFLMT